MTLLEGILYRLSNSTKTRQEVAQRLETAGCKVDLTGTDWHQTGNFELSRKNIKDEPKLTDQQNAHSKEQIFSKLPKRINPPVTELIDKVLLVIANNPGLEKPQMAEELNLPIEKLRFLVKKLLADGYVRAAFAYMENDLVHEFHVTDAGVKYLVDKDLF